MGHQYAPIWKITKSVHSREKKNLKERRLTMYLEHLLAALLAKLEATPAEEMLNASLYGNDDDLVSTVIAVVMYMYEKYNNG